MASKITASEIISPDNIKTQRINSIDMMRGLVMLIMLVDHVRERFFLHMQVADPMDIDATSTGLFFSRLAAHICAPTFIFLTGLSAWLYRHRNSDPTRSLDGFLVKRGLLLIALECTLITFSWMGNYHTIWLQVIWAIGLCMLALAALYRLPWLWQLVIGLLLVFGHNLLTPIHFEANEWGYSLWTILHDRGYLFESELINIRISYPVLPWIGVILLGYAAGPLYSTAFTALKRQQWLLALGMGSLSLFALLRGTNFYGETLPWQYADNFGSTFMSIVNVTKYPPSLAFLLLTLGLMFLILNLFERKQWWFTQILSTIGSVPMFFYILHLYVLLVIYCIAVTVCGTNKGSYFGVDNLWNIWLIAALLAVVLYLPTKSFAAFKRKTSMSWIKYF